MSNTNENNRTEVTRVENTQKEIEEVKKKSELDEWINSFFIALIAVLIIRIFIFAPTKVVGPSMEPTLINKDRLITERVSHFLKTKPSKGDVITFAEPHSAYYTESNMGKKIFYFFTKKEYIKRVIAVEGDRVQIKADYITIDGEDFHDYEIKGDQIFVNGKLLTDSHRANMENAKVYVNGKEVKEDYTNGPWSVNINIEDGKITAGPFAGSIDMNLDVKVDEGYVYVMGDNRDNSSDSRKFCIENGDVAAKNGCINLNEISGRVVCRFWPMNKLGSLNE